MLSGLNLSPVEQSFFYHSCRCFCLLQGINKSPWRFERVTMRTFYSPAAVYRLLCGMRMSHSLRGHNWLKLTKAHDRGKKTFVLRPPEEDETFSFGKVAYYSTPVKLSQQEINFIILLKTKRQRIKRDILTGYLLGMRTPLLMKQSLLLFLINEAPYDKLHKTKNCCEVSTKLLHHFICHVQEYLYILTFQSLFFLNNLLLTPIQI